jgi:hypothetical protein
MDDYSASVDSVVSPLGVYSNHLHEMFVEFIKAGFSEEQAVKICVALTKFE